MDPVSAALMTFGIAILVASWVILLVVSFKEDFSWGLCSVFFPPLAYFYGFFNWAKANDAIKFAILGCVLVFLAL
ncbi:MAG: hypothetical protein ACRBCS_11585 [Cellvibrionaceae bacterium]